MFSWHPTLKSNSSNDSFAHRNPRRQSESAEAKRKPCTLRIVSSFIVGFIISAPSWSKHPETGSCLNQFCGRAAWRWSAVFQTGKCRTHPIFGAPSLDAISRSLKTTWVGGHTHIYCTQQQNRETNVVRNYNKRHIPRETKLWTEIGARKQQSYRCISVDSATMRAAGKKVLQHPERRGCPRPFRPVSHEI